nr:hypothetical protein BaRGS_016299 [Batillaria attramentaria]
MLSGLLWMDAHALLSTLADNQRQAADRRHVVLRDTAILLQAGFKGGNVFLALGALFRKLLTCVTCTVQLVLVYSKAFTFLFYFFLLLTVLCVFDLLIWVGRVIIPGLRDAAVQRYLAAVSGGDGDGAVSQLYPRFSEYLGWDGRLLLALTADYCGPLAAADLTNHLARTIGKIETL